MSCTSSLLNFIHFAEDPTALISGEQYDDLLSNAKLEFMHVDRWLTANRLSLNVDKTFHMIIIDSGIECGPTHPLLPFGL